MNQKLENTIKIVDWVVKLGIVVIAIVFWVQTQGDGKYTTKENGNNLRKEINILRVEFNDYKKYMNKQIEDMRKNNRTLLSGLSKIQGQLEASKND